MKLLQELLSKSNRFNDEDEDLPSEDDTELEDLPQEDEDSFGEDEDLEDLPPDDDAELGDEIEDDVGEENLDSEEDGQNDDQELDQVANKSTQDPDKCGLIRTVKGAHLVYKRETEEGTFEELWTYNSGESMKDELKTRRAIIAGTDIPQNQTSSPDGKQKYTVWSAGNVELLQITGLPS